ncbi:MAG: glycosyltransferase family 9 protein [Candidatus Coatesbacteria bacterium]|nr:MAG: glycosyltransferase family 9 protein [Candidatus Coatesbacteria bacterium]
MAGRLARPFVAAARPVARLRRPREDRLLVVQRILRLGDTFVARPALAALRGRFPGAELAVVCREAWAAVCEADSLVDRVIPAAAGLAGFRAAAREARAFGAATAYLLVPDRCSPYLAWLAGAREIVGYDYASRGGALTRRVPPPLRANVPTFLYPEGAPPIGAADIWLRLVEPAAPTAERYPPFDPGAEARRRAGERLEAAGLEGRRPLVILHPGAANPSYKWREEAWAEAGGELLRRGAGAVVVTGGPAEGPAVAALVERLASERAASAAGASVLETCALIEAADVVVSLDTAPVHVASTMGTPVVALYGPGEATMWAPVGVPHRLVQDEEAPCRGCKAARCFQDRHYCMEAITPAAVSEAATELLEGRNA